MERDEISQLYQTMHAMYGYVSLTPQPRFFLHLHNLLEDFEILAISNKIPPTRTLPTHPH